MFRVLRHGIPLEQAEVLEGYAVICRYWSDTQYSLKTTSRKLVHHNAIVFHLLGRRTGLEVIAADSDNGEERLVLIAYQYDENKLQLSLNGLARV